MFLYILEYYNLEDIRGRMFCFIALLKKTVKSEIVSRSSEPKQV